MKIDIMGKMRTLTDLDLFYRLDLFSLGTACGESAGCVPCSGPLTPFLKEREVQRVMQDSENTHPSKWWGHLIFFRERNQC